MLKETTEEKNDRSSTRTYISYIP